MARQALERCDELTIGLTNPDPARREVEREDPTRHRPENNPLTYWERFRVVREVLLEDGVAPSRFGIVPFDVNHLDTFPWEQYMPRDARWFLRVKGTWGEEKARRLEARGLRVVRLPFREYTQISGSGIRRAIAGGEASWRGAVPPPVASMLESMGVLGRIRRNGMPPSPREN